MFNLAGFISSTRPRPLTVYRVFDTMFQSVNFLKMLWVQPTLRDPMRTPLEPMPSLQGVFTSAPRRLPYDQYIYSLYDTNTLAVGVIVLAFGHFFWRKQ